MQIIIVYVYRNYVYVATQPNNCTYQLEHRRLLSIADSVLNSIKGLINIGNQRVLFMYALNTDLQI